MVQFVRKWVFESHSELQSQSASTFEEVGMRLDNLLSYKLNSYKKHLN